MTANLFHKNLKTKNKFMPKTFFAPGNVAGSIILFAATIISSLAIIATLEATNASISNLSADIDNLIVPANIEPLEANFKLYNVSDGTVREISAYNSVPEQTWGDPCIAADNTNICERYAAGELICAANFVPLGTKLYIDTIGECTVADRMNRRYTDRVDFFMDKDIAAAKNFGIKKLKVLIVK